MVGDTYIQGSQPVEYVEETAFATAETDPSMNWPGLVTSFNPTVVVEDQVVKYLPDHSSAVDLQTLTVEKVSEMHTIDMTYHPQDLTLFQYFMGGSGSLGSDLTSIEIGQADYTASSTEYQAWLGVVGEELTLTIDQDSVAEVQCSFLATDVDGDWDTNDYIGKGSHASEDTTAPLSYDDLGSVQWGGSALGDAIETLTLTISNDLTVVKDPDATNNAHISGIVADDREITVELALTYDDMSIADTVRSFQKQDLTFDFGPSSESWTVTDAAFPELPYEMTPEDLIGDSVTSEPVPDLAYA